MREEMDMTTKTRQGKKVLDVLVDVLQKEAKCVAKPMAKHTSSFGAINRRLASLKQKRMSS